MHKYARLERERRFLLGDAPPAVAGALVLHIEDRYLNGTRMRVRRVRQEGRDPVYKLGQKIRTDEGQPSTVAHTTLYLNKAEYVALQCLPGQLLSKTRTLLQWGHLTLAVDAFAGRLEGLVLAEVDLGENAVLPADCPLPWLAEVTNDERFTGGALAVTSAAGLRRILDEYRPTSSDLRSSGE